MKDYDLIIIGSGPAGLSSAQYSARSNLSTLVIDSPLPNSQLMNIWELENYPGIFPAVNGFDFLTTMQNQAKSFGAEIQNHQIDKIEKDETSQKFIISCQDEQFSSKAIVVATGAKHRKLEISGEEEFTGKGVSYCATCDGPFFKNKTVVVVGGGDSACSEAEYLSSICEKVIMIHRKSSFRAQKSLANRVLSNSKIQVIFNSVVNSIEGSLKVESVTVQNLNDNSVQKIQTDGIFIFAGMIPQTELFENLEKDQQGYIITDEKMQTSQKGIFCAGDVRSKSFRQIVTATSDGAIASHSASEYIKELNNEVYL
jgi:thioredoxin reductase (NADPH)